MTPAAGHRFPEKEFVVEALRVDEFVHALGVDPEPGWEPRPGASVPPGFLMYVTTYGPDEIHEAFGLTAQNALYGGMKTEFFREVRIGDRLRVSPIVSDVMVKSGSQGDLTFIELTCEYVLPDGTMAVRERSTTIKRGRVDA